MITIWIRHPYQNNACNQVTAILVVCDTIWIKLKWKVDKYQKKESSEVLMFYNEYSFRDWANGALIFSEFFQNLNNSLSFSLSFIKNTEPIEQNINSILPNKYSTIWCRMSNYKKLWEITSSSISFFALLQMFVYVWSNL